MIRYSHKKLKIALIAIIALCIVVPCACFLFRERPAAPQSLAENNEDTELITIDTRTASGNDAMIIVPPEITAVQPEESKIPKGAVIRIAPSN